MMRQITVWLAVLSLFGLRLLPLAPAAEPLSIPGIEFHQYRLAGKKLHLLVETYRRWNETLHRSATGDCKGYLLTIDLDSQEPFLDRVQIVGPLWDVPNPRSTISFDAGAEFTKEDTAARVATPTCFFDDAGSFIRIIRVSKELVVRDALIVDAGSATWKRLGEVKPIPDKLPPMSEDRVFTPSRRFLLIYQEGEASLFDCFTGEAIQDQWLTDRFQEIRKIPNFSNVRHYLTDDLKSLVVYPEELWRNKQGQEITTFQIAGETYNRGDYGFVYRRPDKNPTLFRQVKSEYGRIVVFPAKDQIQVLSRDWRGSRFRVNTLDRKTEIYSPPVEKIIGWDEQPLPESHEIALLKTEEIPDYKTFSSSAVATLARWNYQTNKLTQELFPIQKLFSLERGQFQPKRTITIK